MMTVGLWALPERAMAVPVTGSVTFGGVIADTNFLTTNSIDITGNQASVTCAVLSVCEGVYSSLAGAIIAVYNDFTFNPLPGGGYTPLWSFSSGGVNYSFDLLAVNDIDRDEDGILITGSGIARVTGFDPTPASWSFSADRTNIFAFSSTTSAVPDGGSTLTLLGFGLLAATSLRRRFSRR